MKKIILLAGNTFRASGYAQILSQRSDIELKGLFYGFNDSELTPPELNNESLTFFQSETLFIPDLGKTAISVFNSNALDYENLNITDVNADVIIDAIKKEKPDYVIYAGYGGQILSKNHFKNKTDYLHAHPGLIPEERGSTTIYYSILNRKKCGVSVFYMNDEIDAGKVISRKDYTMPSKNINIDVWYDNIIRANCMSQALDTLLLDKQTTAKEQIGTHEDYFVIHPLLKHISILSLK